MFYRLPAGIFCKQLKINLLRLKYVVKNI